MDIRRWFTSTKATPSTTAVPGKEKNTETHYVSNTKTKKDEPGKKPRKKRNVILDSESDEDDPVPSKRGSITPKKKTKMSEENNELKSPEENSSKKRATKAPSPKLKPTTSSDFFGSAPVVRNNKRTVDGVKKSDNDSFAIHDDDDFNKTLQQLDEAEKKKKKHKKEDKSSKSVCEMEFVKHKSKEKSPEVDIPKKKAIKSDEADFKVENKRVSPRKAAFKSDDTEIEVKNKKLSPSKAASKSDDTETEVKNKRPSPSKVASKSGDIEAEVKNAKVTPLKTTPKSNNVEAKVKNEKETDKETLSAQKRREGYMLYKSFLDREGPKALGSKEIPEGEEGCLSGKSFIITGILESIERDDAKALIEKYGGKVMASVTKNTKYVVVGRDPGPGKMKKAESFGTKQLNEDELFDLIRTSPGNSKAVQKKGKTQVAKSSSPDSGYGSVDILKPAAHELIKSFRRETDETSEDKKPSTSKQITSGPTQKPAFDMWVDKYKPTSLKQVIGQQGDKSNAKKLLHWLSNWGSKTGKAKKPSFPGRWNSQDDGSSFKAALLSGPPGVGKTTTAQLVCQAAGFDYFELNASDTRSKKTLQQVVAELFGNQTLAGCFKEGNTGKVTKNHAVIMDEVDGMAGNEDRGGVQELIGLIKASQVPVICICNDRSHPKIRSLSNYCFDLRFQKPRLEQIKAAMMSVAYKEGLKIAPNVLQDVIVSSNQDIRQVLHNLSMWTANEKGLSDAQAKSDIGKGTKHIKMSPFDVLREVFAIGNSSKATVNDKSELFFQDYSIGPLFVQENYVHVNPRATSGNKLKHLQLLSEAANSICDGDLVDRQIRSSNSWSLLPTQAIFSSVIPGELLTGYLNQMISFPAWLGKNSNRNHMDRILQELQMHMRMKITGNKTEVAMDYLPLLCKTLTNPLLKKEAEGIPEALSIMDNYFLLREDFDNIIELSLWPNQSDPRTKINSKVKSAFTRAYNKECGRNPYSVQTVSKKKKSQNMDSDIPGEEGEEDNHVSEEEEDDSLENDAMVKVKKPSKKAAVKGDAPSTSKKGDKTSKRGRSKK